MCHHSFHTCRHLWQRRWVCGTFSGKCRPWVLLHWRLPSKQDCVSRHFGSSHKVGLPHKRIDTHTHTHKSTFGSKPRILISFCSGAKHISNLMLRGTSEKLPIFTIKTSLSSSGPCDPGGEKVDPPYVGSEAAFPSLCGHPTSCSPCSKTSSGAVERLGFKRKHQNRDPRPLCLSLGHSQFWHAPYFCFVLVLRKQKFYATVNRRVKGGYGYRYHWVKWSESHSVVSNSLWPYGLYSPWNSPGQNTGVGSLSLSRLPSQHKDQIQDSRIAGRFFTHWATREASQVPPKSPKILPSVFCFLNTKDIISLYSAGLKRTCLQDH